MNKLNLYPGGTNTGIAISEIHQTGFNKINGARAAIPQVLLVLTDGQSTDSVVGPSAAVSGLENAWIFLYMKHS